MKYSIINLFYSFREFLDFDLTLKEDKVQQLAGMLVTHFNAYVTELRRLFFVEDIVDSGYTLRYLMDMLGARGPRSIKSCVLVGKPAGRKVDVRVDYLGFEIPDVWAVGYGLDYKDEFRALPYIGQVRSGE